MYNKKLIYCIIPARSGSKSIKNKNIYPLNKIPLICYSIRTSKLSKLIDRTFVLTDSRKYAKISIKYGAEIPYIRSKNISKDTSSDFDTIFDFFNQIKKQNIPLPSFIVHLRPTSPIRDFKIIDKAIKKFVNLKNYTSLRSIHKMSETAYKSAEIVNNQLVSTFTLEKEMDKFSKPRQMYPSTFHPNGYVDILNVNFILQNKKLLGKKVFPFITNDPCDIDSFKEITYAEYLLKNKLI